MTNRNQFMRATGGEAAGFSLMELMAVLSLLGTFVLLASQTFITATKMTNQAAKDTGRLHAAQSMLRMLREDVATAAAIDVKDASHAELRSVNGPAIHWTIEPAGTVIRNVGAHGDEPATTQSWNLAPEQLHFASSGAALMLRSRAHSGERVAVFDSELIVARRLMANLQTKTEAKP